MDNWTGFALCASKASDQSKARFYFGKKSEIVLLIVAAGSPIILPLLPYVTLKVANIVSVISVAAAIFVALLIKAIRIEDIWQETRTLSESAKKLMWLYIVNVPPFVSNDKSADSEFLLALEELREQSTVSKDYLAANGVCQDLITKWMRQQRTKSWKVRKDLYLNERIVPQVAWYTTRAAENSTNESNLFTITLGMEFAALLFSILLLSECLMNSAWMGLFTTVATGAYAFEKMNRHKQLADAYSIIAQQLRGQNSLWRYIDTEEALKLAVEKTEDLISRENTNWSVVRD